MFFHGLGNPLEGMYPEETVGFRNPPEPAGSVPLPGYLTGVPPIGGLGVHATHPGFLSFFPAAVAAIAAASVIPLPLITSWPFSSTVISYS